MEKLKPWYLLFVFVLVFLNDLQAQQSATVFLAGYNHIPPVPSPGSGNVTVTLQNDTLSIEGYFRDLSNAFYGAYIHYGEKDERGNQIFRLGPDLNDDKTGGSFSPQRNRWKLNNSQLQALAEGHMYINVYSYDYQRGELRGQIPPLK